MTNLFEKDIEIPTARMEITYVLKPVVNYDLSEEEYMRIRNSVDSFMHANMERLARSVKHCCGIDFGYLDENNTL